MNTYLYSSNKMIFCDCIGLFKKCFHIVWFYFFHFILVMIHWDRQDGIPVSHTILYLIWSLPYSSSGQCRGCNALTWSWRVFWWLSSRKPASHWTLLSVRSSWSGIMWVWDQLRLGLQLFTQLWSFLWTFPL